MAYQLQSSSALGKPYGNSIKAGRSSAYALQSPHTVTTITPARHTVTSLSPLQPSQPQHAATEVAAAPASWREQFSAEASALNTDQLEDRQLYVKLSLAQSSGRLDLTDCRLTKLPSAVFDLTDLEDLSLSGNCLTELPEDIGRLTSLKRLGVAGNQLTALPQSLCKLKQLEGLWLHGNLLESVPEGLGDLTSLQQLSLSGNCLQEIPQSLGRLTALTELGLSGNQLTRLPDSIGQLQSLQKLAVNGNLLSDIPTGISQLGRLTELMLQGNQLKQLNDTVCKLKSLKELSAADNHIAHISSSLSQLNSLQKLWLYGNNIRHLPAGLQGLTLLDSLWLEANPLDPDAVRQLGTVAAQLTGLKAVGLDAQQAVSLNPSEVAALGSRLRVGKVLGSGPGYFKLQTMPPHASNNSSPISSKRQHVLVVAFGSAPGTPNWGGVLGKLYKTATPEQRVFDVLYVVDPCRAWYGGGDYAFQYYFERLQSYTQQYKEVVMIGDSMGATAALLFSPLATAVLAFCPQVDLETASIRPGKNRAWMQQLRSNVMQAVQQSSAHITALCGTWQHDLDQVNLLPRDKVDAKVYSVDSHRLALYLEKQGKLMPVVQDCIWHLAGFKSGNVRISNLL